MLVPTHAWDPLKQVLASLLAPLPGPCLDTALCTGEIVDSWSPFNVSLFHYRSCGSDFVTVLAGIQVGLLPESLLPKPVLLSIC